MKKWIALLLAAMTAFTVIGCGGDNTPSTNQPIDIGMGTPAPETSTEPEASQDPGLGLTQAEAPIGMVDAAAVHTVGLRADGTAASAGHDTKGQRKVSAWENIIYITAGEAFTAGVKNDGTVILAGDAAAIDVSLWSNITSAAAGKAHLVGLKADGTVVAAGDNAAAQCDVSAWSNIVAVAAGDSFTLGLTADGTVVSAGSAPDVSAWKNIVAIDAGGTVAAGLVNDGSAVAAGADASALTGLSGIAAGAFGVVGIKADGTVAAVLSGEADLSTAANVADAAVGAKHVVFMHKDGTVSAYGDNVDLQCAVDQLYLRPHVEQGGDAASSYIIGFRPGMTVAEAGAILKATTGSETACFQKADGTAAADTDLIATGLLACSDAAAPIATVVLMGDVNGDGLIDSTDGDLVQSYVESKSKLEGAFARASRACADNDWSKVIKVTATLHGEEGGFTTLNDINLSVAGMVAIRNYAAGTGRITQYGDWHKEASELNASYKTAYGQNDDTIGYITLDKTNIAYPIMVDYNGKWYYNDHTFEKKSSESASIYAYYYNYQQNNVVTGHNSRPSGSMFHQLHHIQEFNLGESNCVHEKHCGKELVDLPNLNNYAERVWTVNLYGVETRYEIFAMYETKAGCDISETLYDNVWWGDLRPDDEAGVQKWIDKQLSLSEMKFDTEVTTDDTFLTIFTCGNEHSDASKNARLYFFLKRVD